MRCTLACPTFSLLLLCKGVRINFGVKPVKRLLVAVLLQPCAYSLLETGGINLTTSSESSIFISMIPVVTVREEWLIYRKRPSGKILCAIAISFSGLLIALVYPWHLKIPLRYAAATVICEMGVVLKRLDPADRKLPYRLMIEIAYEFVVNMNTLLKSLVAVSRLHSAFW